ncbi:hypothetical protein BX666DRAFT_1966128 [Dichotomocladium elegans]|nr:hypothetical protein BX666DRAFT_1966128 [Dichotomocladium elegans]
MQAVGPSGFYNVPVTKFLMLFVGSCSLLASILDLKAIFHLQLSPHIVIHHQLWRLFTSHCAFTNSGELFFGLLLIYTMRVIERHYGSAKYAAFVFVTLWVVTFLEIGALVSGAKLGFRRVPGGPYAIIFSILYQYYRIIPATLRFRVFGVTFTDKAFIYALALQMMLSHSFSTIVPSICGILSGALYRSDIGNMKRWRFPKPINSWAARVSESSFASGPIPRSSTILPHNNVAGSTAINALVTTATTGLRNRRQNPASAIGNDTATPEPNQSPERASVEGVREYIDSITRQTPSSGIEPPSAEHTAILLSMFPDHPREVIIRAVSSSRNNLSRAVEIMLNTPAPGPSDSASSSRNP